jgi:hypothetical protein
MQHIASDPDKAHATSSHVCSRWARLSGQVCQRAEFPIMPAVLPVAYTQCADADCTTLNSPLDMSHVVYTYSALLCVGCVCCRRSVECSSLPPDQEGGKWTGSCPLPRQPGTFGNICRGECDNGYGGQQAAECIAAGTWDITSTCAYRKCLLEEAVFFRAFLKPC